MTRCPVFTLVFRSYLVASMFEYTLQLPATEHWSEQHLETPYQYKRFTFQQSRNHQIQQVLLPHLLYDVKQFLCLLAVSEQSRIGIKAASASFLNFMNWLEANTYNKLQCANTAIPVMNSLWRGKHAFKEFIKCFTLDQVIFQNSFCCIITPSLHFSLFNVKLLNTLVLGSVWSIIGDDPKNMSFFWCRNI